jgi:hypothetical protein
METTMSSEQFEVLVERVGSYLYEQQAVQLNRKATFAMGMFAAGGFYLGWQYHKAFVKAKMVVTSQ